MNKCVRVQLIGNYLEEMDKILKKNGIICESFISTCNPLALTGKRDETVINKFEKINHLPTLLSIRKNLSAMLSRDPNVFCNNYNFVPAGEAVRYKNTSEYIIVMNTNLRYTIFLKNGIAFSDTYPQNDYTKMLKSDKENRAVKLPFTEDFNWKYYYNKFIDVILNEYDNNHIILIRTNSSQWYMNGDEIEHFNIDASMCRHMIEQVDEYFIERTGCLCINQQYNHIPHERKGCAFPYAISSPYAYKMYSEKIIDIINNKNIERYISPIGNECEFVKFLFSKLSSDVLNDNRNQVDFLRKGTITNINQMIKKIGDRTDFYKNIVMLRRFLDPNTAHDLSDYVISFFENKQNKSNDKFDLEIVKTYLKYFKLDINDIIAVYKIAVELGECEAISNFVANILNNSDCIPLNSALELRDKNINCLMEYPYKNFEIDCKNIIKRYYIRVENNVFFVLDSDNLLFKKVKVLQPVDYRDVIDSGYNCSINDVEMLCSSLSFYVERAKRGNGNTPVTVQYDSYDEFYDSLFYVDYTDILANEKFVLSIGTGKCDIQNYSAICDLSFLLRENTKIFAMGNGFNDQLNFYSLAKVMQNEFDSYIYFDDIYSLISSAGSHFTNLEIHRIVNEDINSLFISNYFSDKLIKYFGEHQRGFSTLPLNLFQCGFTDITAYAAADSVFENAGCNRILLKDFTPAYLRENLDRVHSQKCSYYYFYTHIYDVYSEKCRSVEKYLSFPKFDDKVNAEYERMMLSSDAVVIHIRRGDYVQFSMGGMDKASDDSYIDYNFFVEAITKLQAIDEYQNKQYFVFSDDVFWVQDHKNLIGLDRVGNAPVYYINHNVYNNTYKDMQLMMNGKIMILSQSGFATNAAFLNSRCECLALMRGKAITHFIKAGKKYKYDLEPLPRGRFANWS